MEIKSQNLGDWSRHSPPPAFAGKDACLVFGPDDGGVTDLCLSLLGKEDRTTLEGADITAPAIMTHTDTLSLFGGGTVVLARGATDKHAKVFEAVLQAGINPGARLIVQAGALKSSSKLKKLFASHETACCVALYTLRQQEAAQFAKQILQQLNIGISRDALNMLATELSGDRALVARTCELLSLHAAGSGRGEITREDVSAVCRGINEDDLSAPLDLALQGKLSDALSSLDDKIFRGENPIALLRIFAYRINRYLDIASSGLSISQAIAKARPPVFWTEKDMFARVLGRHDAIALQKVLVLIDRCEDRMVERGVRASIALPEMIVSISKGNLKWPKF